MIAKKRTRPTPKAKANLVIQFSNPDARRYFAAWLCEMGEQDYWAWMEYREAKDKSPDITVQQFDYHGPARQEGEFLCDATIRTVLGRISDP